MTTWFISDLHLALEETRITAGFYQFILEPQAGDTLYILGDFFNYWVGDDVDDEYADQIKQALKATSERGVKLYIMHGNRDFLIGEKFCQQSSCTLLDDPTLIDLAGEPVLLLHGDSLCTKDLDYMAFRSMARGQEWQDNFLSQPLANRIAYAETARKQSQNSNQNKDMSTMDVTIEAVNNVLTEHNCTRMIHGHTHQPNTHNWVNNDLTCERIVLGDWYTHGWYLKVENGQYHNIKFDLPSA
ncbi:MAG: UDP-2,3-diacylglucosamine hydrolase [Psychrobacter glaciei]|jgi:UDP-2,3-diacylglucosamine hydrolase